MVKNFAEMSVQSLSQEDPLKKEMATHSSILAWKITRTEESGGLQATGAPRVGHDEHAHTHSTYIPCVDAASLSLLYKQQ